MLNFRNTLISRGHRQLMVIAGTAADTIDTALRVQDSLGNIKLREGQHPRRLWLGPDCPNSEFQAISSQKVQSELGTENQLVVINAHDAFDADATAALAGTLIPGGLLTLLTPSLDQWPNREHPFTVQHTQTADYALVHPSRYLGRLCKRINLLTEDISGTTLFDPECKGSTIRILNYEPADHPIVASEHQTTGQQTALIDEIVQLAKNRQSESLLVTADRGRGKSAALGLAAAEIIGQIGEPIVVVAPTRRAVAILHRHFLQRLAQPDLSDLLIYLPPDQIDQVPDTARLILVDEAAGIPFRLLSHIYSLGKPTVYSSTINGYEGAGRGFAIRFIRTLSTANQLLNKRQLHEPIRWGANDPLEMFCNTTLMLSDVDDHLLPENNVRETSNLEKTSELKVSEVLQNELAADESLLKEVFALLLQAHYRTCPHDLWHLLDGPNLRLFIARSDQQLVAAALVATEGPLLEPQLRHGIMTRNRRPKGHLLPQLLAQYTMNASPLDMTIARVVRIAVLPMHQRRTIGSQLLAQLPDFYEPDGLDAMGAMFGGAPETIEFWRKAGYCCVHISANAQTSIGYRSVCMLKSFSKPAVATQSLATVLHGDKMLGSQPLTDLGLRAILTRDEAVDFIHPLISHNSESDTLELAKLTMAAAMYDPIVALRYIRGERSLADSRTAVTRLIKNHHQAKQNITPEKLGQQQLKAIQCFKDNPNISMAALAKATNTSGKKDAERLLKDSMRVLLNLDNKITTPLTASGVQVTKQIR